jgi:predicted O-methyltransferase YrrM
MHVDALFVVLLVVLALVVVAVVQYRRVVMEHLGLALVADTVLGGGRGSRVTGGARQYVRSAKTESNLQNDSNSATPLLPTTYNYTMKRTFDRHGRPMTPPNPAKETLDAFLKRAGYPFPTLEGHSGVRHLQFYRDTIAAGKIKRVCEIGFNAGHSAQCFLEADSDIHVLSFDLVSHPYVYYAKMYIDAKFPGRHILVAGTSAVSVPAYVAENPGSAKYDMIFIDGDHTRDGALADIRSMRALARPGTTVIIDNVAPHHGVGIGVYKAWKEAIEAGVLAHVSHHELPGFTDGWAVATYAFPGTPAGEIPDYEHISRFVPIFALTHELDKVTTGEQLAAVQGKIEALYRRDPRLVDEWAKKVLAEKQRKILGKVTPLE